MIWASITDNKDFWQLSAEEVSSESDSCADRLGCAPGAKAESTMFERPRMSARGLAIEMLILMGFSG
jgi:hypothetical protein